ncbi:hypothetical protein A2335_00295 [Candidatus Peregrinibacteria bacterium RIFOXYB2_FULL_32_7]|nr:MAG: hypothetical protein A2335_00295 [Candidatus Peregrinibacteria bacterium RIFOXYB2_FULL_32_7]
MILAASSLVILILSSLSGIFIYNKINELTREIYLNGRNFAELTASQIAKFNDLYLEEGSFLAFNKEMKEIFSKNLDIKKIELFSYQGTIIYDSEKEKNQQYSGPARTFDDQKLLNQIQSQNISLINEDNKIVFLKKNIHGEFNFVDENEQKLSDFDEKARVLSIVAPYDNRLAVKYELSYETLNEKVWEMIFQTLIVMGIGLFISIFVSYIFSSRIVKPLKVLTQGVLTITQGDFKKQVNIKTKDEVGVLARSFNNMALQLDESTKAMLFQERISKEFELASDIQKMILPKDVPKVNGIDIAAGLIPAEAIGGDLFDFIQVDDDNLILYVGDVTGHGVPSGLVVSIANAVVFSHMEEKDMSKILSTTNAVLKAKTLPNMFLTLLMMNWQISTQKMTYVSAGHEQLIYYRASDQKVMLLPAGGMALGMIPDISKILKVQEAVLNQGDVLVSYSDGIPEAWKNEKEMYGIARFKQTVAQIGNLPSAEAIKNAIIADVKIFANGYEQKDDITVMVIKKS